MDLSPEAVLARDRYLDDPCTAIGYYIDVTTTPPTLEFRLLGRVTTLVCHMHTPPPISVSEGRVRSEGANLSTLTSLLPEETDC